MTRRLEAALEEIRGERWRDEIESLAIFRVVLEDGVFGGHSSRTLSVV